MDDAVWTTLDPDSVDAMALLKQVLQTVTGSDVDEAQLAAMQISCDAIYVPAEAIDPAAPAC